MVHTFHHDNCPTRFQDGPKVIQDRFEIDQDMVNDMKKRQTSNQIFDGSQSTTEKLSNLIGQQLDDALWINRLNHGH